MRETTTTTEPLVDYWTSAGYVTLWAEKVSKANRKAVRQGLGSPYTMAEPEYRTRRETTPMGLARDINEAHIVITGEPVSLPGWSLVAVVDWDPLATEPILRVLPGRPESADMLPVPTDKHCDHCKTSRSRRETFLVEGPDGTIEQVGRQCLTAYTGIPLGWVSSVSDVSEEDEGWDVTSSGYDVHSVRSVLTTSIAIVDTFGYVKGGDWKRMPTRSTYLLVSGPRPTRRQDAEEYDRVVAQIAENVRGRSAEAVEAEAQAIVDWLVTETPQSDYIRSLKAIITTGRHLDGTEGEPGSGWISGRNLGFATSAVQAYRRHLGWVAERKAKEPVVKVDVPEGRYEIEGEVRTVRSQETQFGTQVKMRVVSPEGWAVWGTVPSTLLDAHPGIEVGDTVRFTAKVERSSDDSTFGYYSRPTKAVLVERGTTTTEEEK